MEKEKKNVSYLVCFRWRERAGPKAYENHRKERGLWEEE